MVIVDFDDISKTIFPIGNFTDILGDFGFNRWVVGMVSEEKGKVYLYGLQDIGFIGEVGEEWFRERGIQEVNVWKPTKIVVPEETNLVYVVNGGQIVVLSATKQEITYFATIQLPSVPAPETDWNIIVTPTNLLIILSTPTNTIYNYKISSSTPYDFLLVGTISLLDNDIISSPLMISNTNKFLFAKTNEDQITVIRLDEPFLKANHYKVDFGKSPFWFTATEIYDYTVLEVREFGDNNKSADTLLSYTATFHHNPTVYITPSPIQPTFLQLYNLSITTQSLSPPITSNFTL